MSIISDLLIMLLSSTVYLLVFCLLNLFVTDRGVLKFPTIIGDSYISSFRSINFCLSYSFESHFCLVQNSRLIISFFQYFQDVTPLSPHLNVSDENSTVILIFVSFYIICLPTPFWLLLRFCLFCFEQFSYMSGCSFVHVSCAQGSRVS